MSCTIRSLVPVRPTMASLQSAQCGRLCAVGIYRAMGRPRALVARAGDGPHGSQPRAFHCHGRQESSRTLQRALSAVLPLRTQLLQLIRQPCLCNLPLRCERATAARDEHLKWRKPNTADICVAIDDASRKVSADTASVGWRLLETNRITSLRCWR
jgi:hypothetical protein